MSITTEYIKGCTNTLGEVITLSITNPTEKLRVKIEQLISTVGKPRESDIVQIVVLGLEVRHHPEFADMNYVESKTAFIQLDRENRVRYVAVDMWASAYLDMPESLDRELVKRRIYENVTRATM